MNATGLVARAMSHARLATWRWSAQARQAYARGKARRGRWTEMSASDQQIVRDLADNGIHVTTLDRLELADTAAMQAQAEDCAHILAQRSVDDANKAGVTAFAVLADPGDLVSQWPALLLWGLQDRLLDIVEAYLGQPAHCLGVFARRDLADGDRGGTRRWHVDINDLRYLKIIVYLNNVTGQGGPFQYISDAMSLQLQRAGRPKSIDDARVAALGDAVWQSCEGVAGTVILVDTARLYHRGLLPQDERFTLFYSYASRYPSRPDLCADVQFRPGLASLALPLSSRQARSLDWPNGCAP